MKVLLDSFYLNGRISLFRPYAFYTSNQYKLSAPVYEVRWLLEW